MNHLLPLLLLTASLAALDLPDASVPAGGALLLHAGTAATPANDTKILSLAGQISAHVGDDYANQKPDETVSAKKGFASWSTTFRFALPEGHPSGDFTCWIRWKQGGDPAACPQTFAISAGSGEGDLKSRTSFSLHPSGWSYAWVQGKNVTIKKSDRMVEIAIDGKGHDAKVFQAFYLAGPATKP